MQKINKGSRLIVIKLLYECQKIEVAKLTKAVIIR